MTTRRGTRALAGAVTLATLLACSLQRSPAPSTTPAAPGVAQDAASGGAHATPLTPAERARVAASAPAVRVPHDQGPLYPSLMRVDPDRSAGGELLADAETCASCHMDAAAQWRSSAHAFASFNNPVYRASVESFRDERGRDKSRFCAGCHDMALLVDGAMASQIAATDARAHAGVACRTCHGVAATRVDGNGSFDLRIKDVPLPREGDPDSVMRHRTAVALAPLRTAGLCVSCHRAFLDGSTGNAHHLIGQDDASPWQRSAYAGSHVARVDTHVEEKNCQGCHMEREPAPLGDASARRGTIASHRFLGGHTWLASMEKSPETLTRVTAFLKGAVSMHIAGVVTPAGRVVVGTAVPRVHAGERVRVEVAVRNTSVGHRFPGGVMDAQDAWLEVTATDAHGKRVAEAGTRHEATGADPSAHRYASYMADATGTARLARETHEFRANVFNHTILPRDAQVTAFALDVPEGAALPLRVHVRLRHRSRTLALQAKACLAYRTPAGQAFAREGIQRVARNLDPCATMPVVDLGEDTLLLGDEASAGLGERSFDRAFAYALGLSHSVSEHLDDARSVAEIALARATRDDERTAALALTADVLVKQGLYADARRVVEQARALGVQSGRPANELAALDRINGESYVLTWQWADASTWLLRAAETSARDDAAWSALAVVAGGAGDAQTALYATSRGLLAQPRDADMLRVQSLAIDGLDAAVLPTDDTLRDEARRAFLERRAPDDAPKIRAQCNKRVAGCAEERLSVHTHVMR